MKDNIQWCSWCHKKIKHILVKKNYVTRNEYKCSSCGNFTVKCRYCNNMAMHKPGNVSDGEKSFFKSLKENWARELCAEHDGTIANFEMLNSKLDDLKDYKEIFEKIKWNLAKGGKIAGGCIAGATIFCPVAYFAAPGIAAALGSYALLGAASTGTAISSLSGAALTSASLAAIGPGGIAVGIAFITASGAALGAVKGAVVSNNYFGAIKDFKIIKVKDGKGPALIFINGFLSQKNQDSSDWENSVREKYPNNPYYYVTWESSSLYKIGSLICKHTGIEALKKFFKRIAKKGVKSSSKKLNPLGWVQFLADLSGNPWHTSMVKASMTGILLADLLARTKNSEGFILMGHSLGARVIYYLLEALATKEKSPVKDVYLLGGAVDRKDQRGWQNALSAVNGKLINCYSQNDKTLNFFYQGANVLLSSPIGLGDICTDDKKLINCDVSPIVSGHMQYKKNFNKILAMNNIMQ